ncbi:MAG: hypothetical protein SGJ20_10365 [Planctomycetota bacterium]|nr:hypothetical protein [Planctomycetota bacterium]
MPLPSIGRPTVGHFFMPRIISLVALLLLAVAGCDRAEPVTEYTVARQVTPERSRMLAAMIPIKQAERALFFKLVGPMDAVSAQAESFEKFIQSAPFDASGMPDFNALGTPQWPLPTDWTRLPAPATALRLFTIQIGKPSDNLEVAVSAVGFDVERPEFSTLLNVNRWRGQMQLPPMARIDLEQEVRKLPLSDAKVGPALMVDLLGDFKVKSMPPMGAMANAGPQGASSTTSAPPERQPVGTTEARPVESGSAASKADQPLTFDVPAEWQPGKAGGFRFAAFQVVDGAQKVEITLIPLGPDGELLSNVNRWQGEIGLKPGSLEEVQKQTKQIDVGGIPSDYVELIGPTDKPNAETTIAAIVRRPDRTWYIKLRGASDLVQREKGRFDKFLQSVKFQ